MTITCNTPVAVMELGLRSRRLIDAVTTQTLRTGVQAIVLHHSADYH
jgi:hypothetical protein